MALTRGNCALSSEASFRSLETGKSNVTCWLPFLLTYRTLCLAPTADFFAVLEKARQLTPVQ